LTAKHWLKTIYKHLRNGRCAQKSVTETNWDQNLEGPKGHYKLGGRGAWNRYKAQARGANY